MWMKGNFQYWWAWRRPNHIELPPSERDLLTIIKNRFLSCWIEGFSLYFFFIFPVGFWVFNGIQRKTNNNKTSTIIIELSNKRKTSGGYLFDDKDDPIHVLFLSLINFLAIRHRLGLNQRIQEKRKKNVAAIFQNFCHSFVKYFLR